MSHPLSYSILNTSRHPRLPAVTWENSDRLRTFKDFRQKLDVWQREKDGTEKKKEREQVKGGHADSERGPGNHKMPQMKLNIMVKCSTEVHCSHCSSSSSGGHTISRQAGLHSLNLFDTAEPHGIFSSCPIICPQHNEVWQRSSPLLSFC